MDAVGTESILLWMPQVKGPREKLARRGRDLMTDQELLAILLGAGSGGRGVTALAAAVLERAGDLASLSAMSVAELCQTAGVGPAKAARIVAAFEVGLRALSEPADFQEPLTDSSKVFERFGTRIATRRTECFLVIAVDSKNRPRRVSEIARGGRTRCQVDPSEVFRHLIREAASGAIFVHNHPSGDPSPSREDIELTDRLLRAGELLEIRVLDHLIVARGAYSSLRDLGILPTPP